MIIHCDMQNRAHCTAKPTHKTQREQEGDIHIQSRRMNAFAVALINFMNRKYLERRSFVCAAAPQIIRTLVQRRDGDG